MYRISKLYGLFTLLFIACSAFAQQITDNRKLTLDGTWEIIFDHKNEGRESLWFNDSIFEKQPSKQQLNAPACWELIEQDYEGVTFYRHKFEVPATWEGKVIRLQFDAVNYLSEVWLNDAVVGYHEGGFTPFEFRVDELIKPGKTNVISLRAVGPIILSNKEVDGVKPLETPQWRGGITGGIWQSVRLVATGDVYVSNVFIEPKISDNTASLTLKLDNSAVRKTNTDIEINILDVGDHLKSVAKIRETLALHPGENEHRWIVEIPEAVYWSPDNPHLYRAEVNVLNGGMVSDKWEANFGMRELTIKDKHFYLNGNPIYIKATFFEGLYPNGIAMPDNEDMARKEIRLAKEAGFNMIRPWRRPPAPIWLDLADEMGVLVVGSPVLECMGLPISSPYLPARVENEITQTILRDRNRACVVQWELFNELHRPILNQMMRPMAMLSRKLDPTRLILDESGGWAFGANMYLPNEYEPTKFNDIHTYPGPFIDKRLYDGFLAIGLTDQVKKERGLQVKAPGRNVVPGLMSFVSELGYGSLPDLVENNKHFQSQGNPLTPAFRYYKRLAREQQQIIKASGFGEMYPDLQQFCLDQQSIHGAANKRMIEAVRSNPDVEGYCIHALVAGDWILGAGLLDIWRNPKTYAYEATKAANQPRILSIRTKPRNVYADRGMVLEVTGINDLNAETARVQIQIRAEKGDVVYRKNFDTNWNPGVSILFDEQLKTDSWQGKYIIQAKIFTKDNTLLTENTFDFDVFAQGDLKIQGNTVAVLDQEGLLVSFLKKNGITVVDFDKNTAKAIPVFVTGTQANLKKNDGRFSLLSEFMQKGGTTVFIEGVKDSVKEENSVFPFSAKTHPARGLWTCIPHLVHKHPIFQGLPTNGMMRDIYENVWATNTLRSIEVKSKRNTETIVGVVAYDWFSAGNKMHYSGPGNSWWGSDMAVVPVGKGRCIVSQLRLIGNLDKDPVADKILFNMIQFVSDDQARK